MLAFKLNNLSSKQNKASLAAQASVKNDDTTEQRASSVTA